jgi:hypothetical protein
MIGVREVDQMLKKLRSAHAVEKRGDTVGTHDVRKFRMLPLFIDPRFDDFRILFGRRGRENVSIKKTDLGV